MRIAVIGTGGVGAYFGAKLAEAGNDVRFLARGKHLEAIEKNGLLVKSILGDIHIKNAFVRDNIEELGMVDLIMLCVKSWQVKKIAPGLKSIMHEGSFVLPLQNGVLAAKELIKVLPQKSVINGLCRIFSMVEEPGVIAHKGVNPRIVFGELDNVKSQRILQLSTIFNEAGIHHKVAEDIEAESWKKFISICLSGLMAVTNSNYGKLRSIPENRKMMFDLLNEVYHVGIKMGVKLEEDYVEKAVSFIETFNYEATASLSRDVWAERPSEIEYQNGCVVRFAESIGVEVPLNKYVYQKIKELERKFV